MLGYSAIVESILNHGHFKKTRGYWTYGVFKQDFEFDLSSGNFPLLTTRKLGLRSIAAELWCFIHGVTSKATFRQAGTTIWDEWCNPTKVSHVPAGPAREEAMLKEDDLGPIYGFQWRHFGQHYRYMTTTRGHQTPSEPANNLYGDQLYDTLEQLRKNPDSRRMLVSAWCPIQAHMQALPPCHVTWNLCHYDGRLNLFWHQRSADVALGVPFNIASYALLLLLLARHANLRPGMLAGTFVDAHIYTCADFKFKYCQHSDNEPVVCHIAGLRQQVARDPYPLPSLTLTGQQDIFQWKPTDYKLENYTSHPPISYKVAV